MAHHLTRPRARLLIDELRSAETISKIKFLMMSSLTYSHDDLAGYCRDKYPELINRKANTRDFWNIVRENRIKEIENWLAEEEKVEQLLEEVIPAMENWANQEALNQDESESEPTLPKLEVGVMSEEDKKQAFSYLYVQDDCVIPRDVRKRTPRTSPVKGKHLMVLGGNCHV